MGTALVIVMFLLTFAGLGGVGYLIYVSGKDQDEQFGETRLSKNGWRLAAWGIVLILGMIGVVINILLEF
jgi:hypothetical protein